MDSIAVVGSTLWRYVTLLAGYSVMHVVQRTTKVYIYGQRMTASYPLNWDTNWATIEVFKNFNLP